ncbi:MAG: sugar ABC transporter permease [Dehalococcoidales bacterium]|nr:sugar ABC transporter permease [Dehalococcoidales bacterium]
MTQTINLKLKKRNKEGFKYFMYIIPGLILVILFAYKPITGWVYAFTNYKPGMSWDRIDFVGLKNFTRMFANPAQRAQVAQVMVNTFAMAGLGQLTGPLAMAFAIFLNEMNSKRCQRLVQTITTLPHFISWVIMYSMVYYMLSTSGFANTDLKNLGMIEQPINFLATADYTYLKMFLYGTWKGLGWSAIVYLAALAGIDQEQYEAAMIDGANRFQRIWHITVPGLLPTFFVLFIMGIGNFLNTGMEQYYVFQNAMNKEFIQVLDLYVYNQGIGQGNIPFATAVGMLKSIVALVLFIAANTVSKAIRGTSVF